MRSFGDDRFWEAYRKLPRDVRRLARKAYRLFRQNPDHPGLHFKRLNTKSPIYSVRINDDYRALGIKEGDVIVWFWIGSHDSYEHLLSKFMGR